MTIYARWEGGGRENRAATFEGGEKKGRKKEKKT